MKTLVLLLLLSPLASAQTLTEGGLPFFGQLFSDQKITSTRLRDPKVDERGSQKIHQRAWIECKQQDDGKKCVVSDSMSDDTFYNTAVYHDQKAAEIALEMSGYGVDADSHFNVEIDCFYTIEDPTVQCRRIR